MSSKIIKKTFDGKIITIYEDVHEASAKENMGISTIRFRVYSVLRITPIVLWNEDHWILYDADGTIIKIFNETIKLKSYLRVNKLDNVSVSKISRHKLFFQDRFYYDK